MLGRELQRGNRAFSPPLTLPNGLKMSRFTTYMLALTAMAFLVVVVLT